MQSHIYDLRYQFDQTEWRARARRELIYQLWEKYRPPKSKKTQLLDFGCGTGVLLKEFAARYQNMAPYGIDISPKAIKYCHQRGLKGTKLIKKDEIPFSKNSFDLITFIDVLEHIKDDSRTLQEITRTLKPSGLAILIVPAHQLLWSTRDVRLHHFRRYQPGELEKKCRQARLKVLTTKNVDFLLYIFMRLYGWVANRQENTTHISTDIPNPGRLVNEFLYIYEKLENFVQWFTTFPLGTSIAVVVRKSS